MGAQRDGTARRTARLSLPAAAVLIAGCAPGPPPPLFPGLFGIGLVWLLVGLAVWLGVALWKKRERPAAPKTDYLTEALNAVNKRLAVLEEKMEKLGKERESDGK